MMRYARGNKTLSDTEYWDWPRVVLNMNVVVLQRDLLKERRDHIRSEPTSLMGGVEELLGIRKQIQIIDSRWVNIRWKGEIDLRCRPLIAIDEWRKNDRWGTHYRRSGTMEWKRATWPVANSRKCRIYYPKNDPGNG